MKYKYYSKDKKRDIKNRLLIIVWLLSFSLLAVYRSNPPKAEKIVSPISNKKFINKVEAKEPKTVQSVPADQEIFTYAIKVWGKEGRHILIKMFNCFYSESGWRYDALHENTNGTVDAGLAQINDIHGLSLQDRIDYKKNIDKAYEIYIGRGKSFSAWYGSACY